jgi:hypothetical protein
MTDDDGQRRHTDSEESGTMHLEALLREIVARVDPVPAGVVGHADEAFTLSTLDAELAELAWDSWADPAALVRGPDDARILAFETGPPAVRIDLDLVPGANGYELTGEVSPPAAGELRVVYHGGAVASRVDARGRFAADLPSSILSMKLWYRADAATSAPPIVTHWVPIV